MEMGNGTFAYPYLETYKALQDLSYGIAKEGRLGEVPRGIERIQLLGIPIIGKDFVFLTDIMGKIHQNSNGFSFYIPIPCSYA